MSYRNKTYVAFDADSDMDYYKIMKMWHASDNIDFRFHNAHDSNNLNDGSSDETIRRKLRERMNNTKQMVVLVGESTKDLYKFVRWEIEIAISMQIPIVAANLDKTDEISDKTPPILKNSAYFVTVPFRAKAIKYALDNFPAEFHPNGHDEPGSRVYSTKPWED